MTGSQTLFDESLVHSKLRPSELRPDTIFRHALVERLLKSRQRTIVSITAPGGYGKSLLAAQWAATDSRPFAWLSLESEDSDPTLFLRFVARSLVEAGVMEPTQLPNRAGVAQAPTILRSLVKAVAGSRPFVLVVDDGQWLTGEALDSLVVLAREIRRGSQLVLCGRTEIKRILGRGRARGEVFEVGPRELAFDNAEAQQLFESIGLDRPDHVAQEVNGRLEGWPAGLYLCALAVRESGVLPNLDAPSIDRFMADYFESEYLAVIPESRLNFLVGSSALTRMCAELCDAVLERRDSRRLLEEIESSNLFLVPLDHARVWFRYHDLFRAALLQKLEAAVPGACDRLRLRAAEWCESNGLAEDALRYALAAGDHDRAARLISTIAPSLYRRGRASTLREWFASFDDPALISRYPGVSSLAAYLHLLSGRAFQAERWADAAARGLGDDDPLPDGSPSARPWVATIEALLCRHGPTQMRKDAEVALAELDYSSPLRGPAEWLHATSYLLLEGASIEAERRLADAAGVALATGNQFVRFNAQAQRTLIMLERGDEAAARSLFEHAKPPMIEEEEYRSYIDFALISAADARLSLRAGDVKGARDALAVCQRLRPLLTHAWPWYSVHTLVEMAESYRKLEDFNAMRAVLRDAAEILRHRPDLGVLGRRVEQLRAHSAPEDNHSGWEGSLTTAELRLLPLLMTHLTLGEISERLGVSRNTVKTQTKSIYRKLDVSSRSRAVQRAVDLGLLDAVAA